MSPECSAGGNGKLCLTPLRKRNVKERRNYIKKGQSLDREPYPVSITAVLKLINVVVLKRLP